uniref:Tr-type G domain-containing protein n=1 Tax=Schistocephalus solidus TaxID=70667 RepID=A0A0X3PFF0_SCHSO
MNFLTSFRAKQWDIFRLISKSANVAVKCASISSKAIPQDKKKKKPNPSKHFPTVEVWDGIRISEISKLTKRPVGAILRSINSGVLGNLSVCSSSAIEDRELIIGLLSLLGFRANFINKKEQKQPPLDAFPRPPPDRRICVPRPPVVAVMGHVDHGKTTLLDALRSSRTVDEEFGGITQHLSAFSISVAEAAAAAAAAASTNRGPSSFASASLAPDSLSAPLTLALTEYGGGVITFIDTPGHAAFSSMRARGAAATDIVLLVVAADDGVMPQTVESIRFAKESNAQILVAINKMDKYGVDPGRTIDGLAAHGVVVERLGGDVQAVEISALKRTNLVALLEAIVAQSEIMQICADPSGPAEALVLECHTEHGLGKVATCLVSRGKLRRTPESGPLVAGESIARPRVIRNDRGAQVESVSPGYVATVAGWKTLPHVGDILLELRSEAEACAVVRSRCQQRLQKKSEIDKIAYDQKMASYRLNYDTYLKKRLTMDPSSARQFALQFRKAKTDPSLLSDGSEDATVCLPLLIKTDVEGSLEAITDMLDTCPTDLCRLQVAVSGVGPLTPAEAELAVALKATVFTFNVEVLPEAAKILDENSVAIHNHNIIYRLAEDVRSLVCEKLPPVYAEEVIGEAVVLQTFEVTIIRGQRQEVTVAGCRCTKGRILCGRSSRPGASGPVLFRVLRPSEDNSSSKDSEKRKRREVIVEKEEVDAHANSKVLVDQATCFSLRHGRNDVESVRRDVELGIILTKAARLRDDLSDLYVSPPSSTDQDAPVFDNWRPGDILQCYQIVEKARNIDWQIEDPHKSDSKS